MYLCRGDLAFRGGGGGGGGGGVRAPPSLPWGIRHPADPKGPPLYYFEISIFGVLHFWYAYFEGGRAPKKRDFLVKCFQKMPKNAFIGLFF